MAKNNPNFQYDMFKFIHKPIRQADKNVDNFLERYMFGPQIQFERAVEKINRLVELYDPAKTPQPRLLKDIVGLTSELDNITQGISDEDLRKLIALAVPLWKQIGLEVGYKNIIRLFTGKNSRVFNWFDFRYIVGEQGLAQEELGEDSWFISVPGVGATDPGPVVLLLPFEENFLDRSLNPINVIPHGSHQFFENGPTTGSNEYVHIFDDGIIEVPNTAKLDFSGDFTIEGFFQTEANKDSVLLRKAFFGSAIEIRVKATTNEIEYAIDDGVTTITETVDPGLDLDDGTFRHFALVLDRVKDRAKFFLDGSEISSGQALGALGDPSNQGKLWIGGAEPSVDLFEGSFDNIRISTSAQYDVDAASLAVPGVAFVPYQEEQLDEFFSDVRVVDDGTLNRTLVLRILNLMRPSSERLRVIYIRFFEAFEFGKGDLASIVLGSYIQDGNLVLPSGAVERVDTADAPDFQDIVLQARAQIESGDSFSVRVAVQDANNFYRFRMRADNQTFELEKVVAGAPTSLATPVSAEIYRNTFYVLSVTTDYDVATNELLIRCYQDRNLVFEIRDNTFTQGAWSVESGIGAVCSCSEIEMFKMPLEFDIIEPNQDF